MRLPRLIGAALAACLGLAPLSAIAQTTLQQPVTTGAPDLLPAALGKLYQNDLYLQGLIGTRFQQLGPVAFLNFGTTPGTVADGGALTAETARATAAEQANATGIANLATGLNLKAPIASPNLTGIPTAPTAANGTSTNQIATTAFVLANAGSGGGSSTPTAVLYSAQTLTAPQQLQARQNIAGAGSGANSDITSLSGLTTPLSVAQGGTGASAASGARTQLGAAASGANTDITSLASPALAAATATTQAANDNSTKVSTTAYADRAATNAAAAVAPSPAAAVRLNYTSPTALTLVGVDGAQLFVNGANRTVPNAGVTLSNGSAAASTAYYIYDSYSGSAHALSYSTTAPTVDSTTGLQVMSGNSALTLVGAAVTNASGQWQPAPLTSSYFNRRDQVSASASTAVSTSSGTASELSTGLRAPAWVWPDEALDVEVVGFGSQNTPISGHYAFLQAATDAGVLGQAAQGGGMGSTTLVTPFVSRVATKPGVAGLRYGTAYGYVDAAGGFNANFTLTTIVKTRG